MNQPYISVLRPSNNTSKALFEYSIRYVQEKNLFDTAYTHQQWANVLFGYEKTSSSRIDMMSKVKRDYFNYFSRSAKYSFLEEKIIRDFPQVLGIQEDNDNEDEGEDSQEFIGDIIKVLGKEICEQRSPDNQESYKGDKLVKLRKNGTNYIYQVSLQLKEGDEPHINEGLPFILKVYGKRVYCEVIDFDFDNGNLFFSSNTFINPARYCTVLMDSSFVLEGLRQRLQTIRDNGIDDYLPFAKFIFEDTDKLAEVSHKPIPHKYKKGLDESQEEAFNAAFDNDITFIWGPPGTGKSNTLASIIYALYKLETGRTAVCCLSNVAVDQLLGKLIDRIDEEKEDVKPGNIYRAGRSSDRRILSTDYLFPNDDISVDLREQIKNKLDRLSVFKERKRDMTEEAIALKASCSELREKLKSHTEHLVSKSKIVFSTISNFVLTANLCDSEFDNLIVDEASMLSMPSLIALGNKIKKRLIFVGDFLQLSPIALVKDDLLTDSVFEMANININETAHPALHQLLNQRRSDEKIVNLINESFYQGRLIAKKAGDEKIIKSKPYPNRVIALDAVTDGAVKFTKGGTRQNRKFAEAAVKLLDEMKADGGNEFSIGIITPYKGEVSLLKWAIHEKDYPDKFTKRIKVGTIHTFQGSECDVIIFDMVDCAKLESGRECKNIGRLYAGEEGERLLNVAVSRARNKLIVIGDPIYMNNIPGNTLTYKTRRVFRELCRYVTLSVLS